MTTRLNGLDYDTPPDPRMGSVSTTSGAATVYLTDDGTATGNALLSSVFIPPLAWINSSTNAYPAQATLSGDLKTLTINAKQQGTSNTNVLINLIGGLTSVLTGITYGAVPNGTVVNYFILASLA